MPSSAITTLRVVAILFILILLWAIFGKVDIIAEAPGRLVPTTYVKIVQPTDAGVVSAILVSEGDEVKAGQTLLKLDPVLNEADRQAAEASLKQAELTLRRIEAELDSKPFEKRPGDPAGLYATVAIQYEARRHAYQDLLAQEKAALVKTQADQESAQSSATRLQQEMPTYIAAEESYKHLVQQGLAGKLVGLEKQRDRLEKEKELGAARAQARSLQATIEQQKNRVASITSDYRKNLLQEQVDVSEKLIKLRADVEKYVHKADFNELKAPQDAIVKELAVRSKGAVVSPGTVLLTLVPKTDPLQAEVFVKNEDVGFIYPSQKAQVKVAALPFQKFGLVDGTVGMVTADAAEGKAGTGQDAANGGIAPAPAQNGYRTLIKLKQQHLTRNGQAFPLKPGMQVVAEVNLGTQTVMEYLLSPVKKTLHEAIRER